MSLKYSLESKGSHCFHTSALSEACAACSSLVGPWRMAEVLSELTHAVDVPSLFCS